MATPTKLKCERCGTVGPVTEVKHRGGVGTNATGKLPILCQQCFERKNQPPGPDELPAPSGGNARLFNGDGYVTLGYYHSDGRGYARVVCPNMLAAIRTARRIGVERLYMPGMSDMTNIERLDTGPPPVV